MARERHDDGPAENRQPTEALALLHTRCGECGGVTLLAFGAGCADEQTVTQARWVAGMAQLRQAGWVCRSCITGHASHDLREAARSVRAGHLRMRVDASARAQAWRSR